jgi:hypothetical protein
MPPPVGRVDVTAADIGGSAPITTIELPANGGAYKAEDLRNVWAASAKNNNALVANDSKTTTTIKVLNPIGSGGGSLEVFNTFPGDTLSAAVFVDIASVAVGDKIDASLVFDATATVVAGDYVLTLIAIEDYGGTATQTDIPGARRFWRPAATDRYILSLQGLYTIATAGPLRVILEVALPSAVALNNFGTGSLIVRRTHVGA